MDIQLVRSFSTIDSVRRSMSLGWALLGWSIRFWNKFSIRWVRYGRSLCRITVNSDATVHLRASQPNRPTNHKEWHHKQSGQKQVLRKNTWIMLAFILYYISKQTGNHGICVWHHTFEPKELIKLRVHCKRRKLLCLTCPLGWSSSAPPEHGQNMWEMSDLELMSRKLGISHPSLTSLHPDQNT